MLSEKLSRHSKDLHTSSAAAWRYDFENLKKNMYIFSRIPRINLTHWTEICNFACGICQYVFPSVRLDSEQLYIHTLTAWKPFLHVYQPQRDVIKLSKVQFFFLHIVYCLLCLVMQTIFHKRGLKCDDARYMWSFTPSLVSKYFISF